MKRLKLDIQFFADGKIVIETEMDSSGLDQGLDSIRRKADEAGGAANLLGTIISSNLVSGAITKGLSLVASGIGSITSAVNDLVITGGFDRAVNIEQAEFKLKGLGHSAEEVDDIMKNALASVKGTAYGLDEAATIAASAVAAGVEPGEDLERTLKLVADAAAISGRDMGSMGAIFNKVAAAGKMTGQELNQLTDAGIPMLDLLGQTLGKTTEEVKEMVSAGEIGFDEFRDAIEKGMGGAALTLGQTFEGSLSNVKAAAARLGESFMSPLMDSMTPALGTITNIIDALTSGSMENIDNLLDTLATQIQDGIFELIENLEPIIENVLTLIDKLIPKAIETLSAIIPKLIPVVMNAINTIIITITKNLPDILKMGIQILLEIIKGINEGTRDLIPVIIDVVFDIIDVILDMLPEILDVGIEILMVLTEGIFSAQDKLLERLPDLIQALITTLIAISPQLIVASIQLIAELTKGLIMSIPTILKSVPQIIGAIISGLINGVGEMLGVGGDLVAGLWQGISNSLGWIKNKITGWVGNVLSFIKRLFGIASPAKTTMVDGKFLAQGLGVGFDKELDNVFDDMQKAVDIETAKMSANVQSSGTYQMAMAGVPTFNLLDNSEHTTKLEVNGKVLAEVVNTENRNREVATAWVII